MLSKYPFSKNVDVYFCKTCGSQMFWHHRGNKATFVMAGTVQDLDEADVELKRQRCVEDTKDGGLSVWLPTVRVEGGGNAVSDLAKAENAPPAQNPREDTLIANCVCQGVTLAISRPDESSARARRPITDLFKRPFPTKASENLSRHEKDGTAWWLRSHGRYPAGNCACTSCAKASGMCAVQWAFIPKTNISHLKSGSSTLKEYKSSPGATRYFCSRCGASVFWTEAEDPQVVDVAVGLLNAESGARADDWLDWLTYKVSYREDAPRNPFVHALESGLLASSGLESKE